MNFYELFQSTPEILQNIWEYTFNNPLIVAGAAIGTILGFKLFVLTFRYVYVVLRSKTLVYMKVTLPREESQKDKEKSEVKDFREKISVM